MNTNPHDPSRELRSKLRVVLSLATGVLTMLAAGCAHHGAQVETSTPTSMVEEPATPERVDLNRTAPAITLPDRTNYTVDDAVARARLAEEKGSIADLRMAAAILKPFGPDSRRWHAEDQARVARHQLVVGLGANDEACIRSGISNLVAAKPSIRGAVYENEISLLYLAHARLGWPRPDAAPTRLSSAMALFANPRHARRVLAELNFVEAQGGDATKQVEFEKQVQESLFEFLSAWAKGESTNAALQDLLQASAMAEYRGYRVYLPSGFTDADTFAVRLIATLCRDLGAEI